MPHKAKLDAIDFAISTVSRPKDYLHNLISHLRKDLSLRLIVGSPIYDYLQRYRENPAIEIIGVDPGEWNRFERYPVKHRASWNYWRCLVYGVKPGRRNGLVILEDDVIPAKGWENRLHDTIGQLESEFGQEYVLALYTAFSQVPTICINGKDYAQYPSRAFFGTQAMYYPEPIRIAFAEYLRREGVETIRMHYDILLSDYLGLTGIPLFATVPCLFQHVGKIGTGLSLHFHRAGNFVQRARKRNGTFKNLRLKH